MQHLFPTEIANPEKMIEFGQTLGSHLKSGDVVALIGDLGAGKTHLVKGIALAHGYLESVTSPTFALVNEYTASDENHPTLLHLDLYRMESAEELIDIGWEEMIDSDAIVIAEWADRFPELMPPGTHCILVEHLELGRKITYDTI